MFRLTAALFGLVAAGLSGCSESAPSYGPGQKLSDDDIAAYAVKAREQTFRKKAELANRIIGAHNGTRVVADFPHLDDGESLLAIIHYDVEPGEACKRAGGSMRLELVPDAITAFPKPYCVPKVLVDRHIQSEPIE